MAFSSNNAKLACAFLQADTFHREAEAQASGFLLATSTVAQTCRRR